MASSLDPGPRRQDVDAVSVRDATGSRGHPEDRVGTGEVARRARAAGTTRPSTAIVAGTSETPRRCPAGPVLVEAATPGRASTVPVSRGRAKRWKERYAPAGVPGKWSGGVPARSPCPCGPPDGPPTRRNSEHSPSRAARTTS